jgi:hypothetical protein
MIKHHLPPGLDIDVGSEINEWKISFIEPIKQTKLFPVEIKENEIPDYYFFVIVDNPGSYLYANIGLLNVFFGPTDLVGFIVEFFSLSSYSLDLGRYSLISPIYLAFLSLIF